MSRVAIIGSCITRDLWPIRGEAEQLFYVSRTSLASLFAAPVAGLRVAKPAPEPLSGHPHRALLADLQKTALAQLVAFRPTHLIFDLIDERFDLLSAGGAICVHSWELEVSGYLSQKAFARARPIPRLSDAAHRLWSRGAGEMAALIRATPLSKAQLILHSARWAERAQNGRRLSALPPHETQPGQPVSTPEHNRMLAAYEAELLSVMPPMTVVQAPEHRIADANHRWGLSPFHYVPAYYEAIWDQLAALGVSREITPRGAAPNDRAA